MSFRLWERLTREQPKTLAAIVQYSKRNADLIPSPKELSQILNISEPAAKERIARLKSYFIKRKGALKVNVNRLCTRKDSALFFLIIQSMSLEDKDGRVFMSCLIENLTKLYKDVFTDAESVDFLLSKGIETGYLIQDIRDPGCVRPGILINYQSEYLKLISN